MWLHCGITKLCLQFWLNRRLTKSTLHSKARKTNCWAWWLTLFIFFAAYFCDPDAVVTPANGRKIEDTGSNDTYIYNNAVTFQCNVGYRLVGNNRMKCLDKGRWSASPPSCQSWCLCWLLTASNFHKTNRKPVFFSWTMLWKRLFLYLATNTEIVRNDRSQNMRQAQIRKK